MSAITAAIETIDNPGEARTKIWFLLDRSGSMQSLTGDVIGGFNRFLDDQTNQPGEAQMTVVLFDGNNPFEVVVDAKTIAEVPSGSKIKSWAIGLKYLRNRVRDH